MKLLADIGVKFRAYKDAGHLLTRALDLSTDYDQARLSYANLLYKTRICTCKHGFHFSLKHKSGFLKHGFTF